MRDKVLLGLGILVGVILLYCIIVGGWAIGMLGMV